MRVVRGVVRGSPDLWRSGADRSRCRGRCHTVPAWDGGTSAARSVVAVAMAVATWVVVAAYDLPVRDPDGVSVPDLVAAAGDRAGRRAPRRPRPVGARTSARRRVPAPGQRCAAWSATGGRGSRSWFTLSGLVAWYVAYVAFRNLKSYVPFVNRAPVGHRAAPARPPAVAGPRPGRRPPPRARHRLGRWLLRGSTCCGSGWCRRRWPSRSSGPGARSPARCTSRPSPSTGCSAWRLLPGAVPRADLLAPAVVRRPAADAQHLGAGPAARRPHRAVLADAWDTARGADRSPPSRRCTWPSW